MIKTYKEYIEDRVKLIMLLFASPDSEKSKNDHQPKRSGRAS